jgi:NADH:ubiquinone oxidoreductase subunit 3 (subunit A)
MSSPQKYSPMQASLLFVLLVALGIFASLPQLPTLIGQGRDSGIFAYTAKVVLDGGVPYRDAWDNKPPMVYYINALAFAVFGVNRWALWIIEIIFTVISGGVFYGMVWKIYQHKGLALLGMTSFVLLSRYPGMVMDGNFTESYALLPQIICLATGYQFLTQPTYRQGILFGLSACLAFLTKQTTIGVALAFLPALLISRHTILKSLVGWKYLFSLALGGMLGLLVLGIYLAAYNNLEPAMDAIVFSPSALHHWVGQEEVPIWRTVLGTIDTPSFHQLFLPLMPFLAACLSLATYQNIYRHEQKERTWLVWLILMFVIDMLLTNITNRSYSHYYITGVPSLVLICIAVLNSLRRSQLRVVWIVGFLFVGMMNLASANAMVEHIQASDSELFDEIKEDALADYLEANTRSDEMVLIWGASSKINFQSHRDSPTQYHYAYPLILPDYTTPDMIAEFIKDLQTEQPVMIVDRATIDGNRVPPLNAAYRIKWLAQGGRRDTADLQAVFDFVDDSCTIVDVFNEAVIYRCSYRQPPTG